MEKIALVAEKAVPAAPAQAETVLVMPKPRNSEKSEYPLGLVKPVLRFSLYAWAKLLFFRDRGDTEIGGFGIAPDPKEPLYIADFVTVPQIVSPVSVEFDDVGIADFFEDQVEKKLKPNQFGRVWLHTHPGNSANPSQKDEETFLRAFGRCDWATMFILANGGSTYTRLRFNGPPRADLDITNKVDWCADFFASARGKWEEEYAKNVRQAVTKIIAATKSSTPTSSTLDKIRSARAELQKPKSANNIELLSSPSLNVSEHGYEAVESAILGSGVMADDLEEMAEKLRYAVAEAAEALWEDRIVRRCEMGDIQ